MNDTFQYSPSKHVHYRDQDDIERCRAIKRQDIEKHSNPDFRIRVVKDADFGFMWLTDMYSRIKNASEEGRSCVMMMPNPCPVLYRALSGLINSTNLDCKHVWFFALDEYANEDRQIAPENWSYGLVHSMLTSLYGNIDEHLRPPRKQVFGLNNQNIDHYYDLMQEAGGVDISYTGPGWTGHLAFVDPDAPEFAGSLEEFMQMGARVATLSPFTLAQNSMHGSFGMSGDVAAVPPMAATIGPKEVIAAKHRWEVAAIGVHGTTTSWQRMIARLCYHGQVSPQLPSSIHQLLRTDCFISETIAADIEPNWDKEY
jgi:glucosamine-6-phosphate deaminase